MMPPTTQPPRPDRQPADESVGSRPETGGVHLQGDGDGLVTVYVVNRNYGRFLAQSIDSVLSQDYPWLDVIVVDDASNDDSLDVLRRYENDRRIRTFRQETNRGLTACCNLALGAARGEFVMRLDADDYLHESAVAKLAAALTADPTAVLVFPDYVEVDGRGAMIRRVQRHDFSALEALSDLPAHGACTLARKTFLDRVGGYDEAIACQDGLDLWLHVRPQDRVLQIGEPLFFYRQHGSNLTRNERRLLRARTKLFARHVAKRGLPRPRVLGVVPVRGRVIDPASMSLEALGDRLLIDWTLDEAVACTGLDRVIVSSPDAAILDHVHSRYGSRVRLHRRSLESAGLNVSLDDTLRDVVAADMEDGRAYDALMTLTVESPFRSRMFMQQAIHVMQLFDADGVVCARHEDEAFYRHNGLGLESVRQDARLRLERDDLFRACGGLRAMMLSPAAGGAAKDPATSRGQPARLAHVLVDQLAAFTIRTSLDWEIAKTLVSVAKQECAGD
jgi:glycosyltransferase involved in cell wall biosynthesis